MIRKPEARSSALLVGGHHLPTLVTPRVGSSYQHHLPVEPNALRATYRAT